MNKTEIKKKVHEDLISFTSEFSAETYYIKRKVIYTLEFFEKEIHAYKVLAGLHITPKLISHGRTCYQDAEEYEWFGTYMVLEKYGVSVLEKYIPEHNWHDYSGPGPSYSDSFDFDEHFPLKWVPESVLSQIKMYLIKLQANGITHEDVHPGNFLVNEKGEVKVIDFECVSFSEK